MVAQSPRSSPETTSYLEGEVEPSPDPQWEENPPRENTPYLVAATAITWAARTSNKIALTSVEQSTTELGRLRPSLSSRGRGGRPIVHDLPTGLVTPIRTTTTRGKSLTITATLVTTRIARKTTDLPLLRVARESGIRKMTLDHHQASVAKLSLPFLRSPRPLLFSVFARAVPSPNRERSSPRRTVVKTVRGVAFPVPYLHAPPTKEKA